jgi:AcrR family transcriptional regulator
VNIQKAQPIPRNTEDRILQNALQHFCNYGYNGTSVREITSASKVTKPTLYYYFKNKEELFTRLAQTCFERVISKINGLAIEQNSYEANVRALFECMDAISAQDPAALRFIHGLVVSPQRGAPDVGAKAFLKQIDDQLDKIMKKAVKSGECVESKRKKVQILLAALLGYYTKSVLTLGENEFTDQEILTSLLKHLLDSSKTI